MTSPAHLAKIIPEFSTLDLPYLFQSPEHATAALDPNTSVFNAFDTLIKDRLNATIVLVQISPLSVWDLTFRTKAPTFTLDDFEGHTFGTEWTNTTTADHLGLFSRQVSRIHLLELTTQIEDRNLSNVVALPDKVFTKRLIETGLAHVLDEQRHCRCWIMLARPNTDYSDALSLANRSLQDYNNRLLSSLEELQQEIANAGGVFYSVSDKDKRGYHDLFFGKDADLLPPIRGITEFATDFREAIAKTKSSPES